MSALVAAEACRLAMGLRPKKEDAAAFIEEIDPGRVDRHGEVLLRFENDRSPGGDRNLHGHLVTVTVDIDDERKGIASVKASVHCCSQVDDGSVVQVDGDGPVDDLSHRVSVSPVTVSVVLG